MSVVDTTERTLQVKIVYYGPGLSGKTTNLEQLSRLLNPERRGDLMVLDTVGDRTLFFDWMPVDLGTIRGFDVKIQLYTVPGQVRYNNTRKRVLAGVDGIVFVADSQAEALDQNEFSLENLRENLEELGLRLEDIPMVVQYNKRDLPSALPMEDLAEHLELEGYPSVESVAAKGKGVLETLRLVTRVTLQAIKDDLDPSKARRRSAPVPMDGQALLAEIMRGDQDARPASSQTRSTEPSGASVETSGQDDVSGASPQGEATNGESEGNAEAPAEEEHIVMEAELPEDGAPQEAVEAEKASYGQKAPPEASQGATTDQETAEALFDLIRRIAAVEGLVTGLGLRVDELTDQTSEAAQVKDGVNRLQARLDEIAGKLDLVQRVASSLGGKVAAVERRVDRMERSDTDPVRAEHVRRLSQLLGTVSDALAEYASVLRPNREAHEKEQSEGGPKGIVS